MYRIDDPSAQSSYPSPEAAGTEGWFTEGVPGVTPATIVRASWLNQVQENLVYTIDYAGVPRVKGALDALVRSIKRYADANARVVSGAITLTADDAGLVTVNAGSPFTITLPAANAANGVPILLTLVRIDATANVVTLARAGSNTINGLTSGITLPVGATVMLRSDGVSAWRLVGSSGLFQRDIFTVSGTATVPWWARKQRVKVWGGGGGGGASFGASSGGATGGGGGFAHGVYDATPGGTHAVTVATAVPGGLASATPTAGTAGLSSSYGSLASATGGGGGAAGLSGIVSSGGGAGGVGSGGNIENLSGANGSTAFQAGTSIVYSPPPGAAPNGPPAGGGGFSSVSSPGVNGIAPGMGGATGVCQANGGNGAAGLVIVEWMA